MRILLVQSYSPKNKEVVFPLGLYYIATALLNNGHEVTVYDPNVHTDPLTELREVARTIQPITVGIGLRNIDNAHYWNFQSYLDTFFETVSLLKKEVPGSKILVGGPGFSIYARYIMERIEAIDYGIFAEGEESMPELLNNLDCPESVKGIFYRRDSDIHFTGTREPLEFANLFTPRRDISDLTPYLKSPFSIGVQTKRGCALKCSYCTYPYLEGRKLRLRPAKDIVDEIQDMANRYGLTTFYFTDSVFNIPLSQAIEICREILARGLDVHWMSYHSEKYIDEEYIKLARDAGCARFNFSPDGITDSTLAALDKESTEKDIEKVYHLARQVNDVKIGFNFFVNGPGESADNLLHLFTFFVRSLFVLRSKTDYILLIPVPIRIFPNTPLHALAIEKGLLKENDDLLKPVFYNPPPLSYFLYIARPFIKTVFWLGRWFKRMIQRIRRITVQ